MLYIDMLGIIIQFVIILLIRLFIVYIFHQNVNSWMDISHLFFLSLYPQHLVQSLACNHCSNKYLLNK